MAKAPHRGFGNSSKNTQANGSQIEQIKDCRSGGLRSPTDSVLVKDKIRIIRARQKFRV